MSGKGKSGGMRIIHIFVAKDGEVHVIDIFEKADKANLSQKECNALAKLATALKGQNP